MRDADARPRGARAPSRGGGGRRGARAACGGTPSGRPGDGSQVQAARPAERRIHIHVTRMTQGGRTCLGHEPSPRLLGEHARRRVLPKWRGGGARARGGGRAGDRAHRRGLDAGVPALHAVDQRVHARRTPGVRINYQSIGSGGGIRQITERTVDFGATDAPMTDEQMEKAPGNHPHPHVPRRRGADLQPGGRPERAQAHAGRGGGHLPRDGHGVERPAPARRRTRASRSRRSASSPCTASDGSGRRASSPTGSPRRARLDERAPARA